MKINGFYIENVVKSGRRTAKIDTIAIGDNVKVVLRLKKAINGVDAEWLWFRVIDIRDGYIQVELDNDPVYIRSLADTERMTIKENNVLEVLK